MNFGDIPGKIIEGVLQEILGGISKAFLNIFFFCRISGGFLKVIVVRIPEYFLCTSWRFFLKTFQKYSQINHTRNYCINPISSFVSNSRSNFRRYSLRIFLKNSWTIFCKISRSNSRKIFGSKPGRNF